MKKLTQEEAQLLIEKLDSIEKNLSKIKTLVIKTKSSQTTALRFKFHNPPYLSNPK